MMIMDVIKEGLAQERRRGDNNFSTLLAVIAFMAMWGGFDLLSENDDKLAERIKNNEAAVHKLAVRSAVLSSKHKLPVGQ